MRRETDVKAYDLTTTYILDTMRKARVVVRRL